MLPASGAKPQAVTRRYMADEGLARARLRIITGDHEEVSEHALTDVM